MYEDDLDEELIAALWEEDDNEELDYDFDNPQTARYFYRPLSVRKGAVTTSQVKVGHIRNRIFVNSTFKAISTEVIGEVPNQSVEQCVFINCKWVLSDMTCVVTENVKFIKCKFYDTELAFSTMKNVTFENGTFINYRGSYDEYASRVTMKNSTFFEIYEIIDMEK